MSTVNKVLSVKEKKQSKVLSTKSKKKKIVIIDENNENNEDNGNDIVQIEDKDLNEPHNNYPNVARYLYKNEHDSEDEDEDEDDYEYDSDEEDEYYGYKKELELKREKDQFIVSLSYPVTDESLKFHVTNFKKCIKNKNIFKNLRYYAFSSSTNQLAYIKSLIYLLNYKHKFTPNEFVTMFNQLYAQSTKSILNIQCRNFVQFCISEILNILLHVIMMTDDKINQVFQFVQPSTKSSYISPIRLQLYKIINSNIPFDKLSSSQQNILVNLSIVAYSPNQILSSEAYSNVLQKLKSTHFSLVDNWNYTIEEYLQEKNDKPIKSQINKHTNSKIKKKPSYAYSDMEHLITLKEQYSVNTLINFCKNISTKLNLEILYDICNVHRLLLDSDQKDLLIDTFIDTFIKNKSDINDDHANILLLFQYMDKLKNQQVYKLCTYFPKEIFYKYIISLTKIGNVDNYISKNVKKEKKII